MLDDGPVVASTTVAILKLSGYSAIAFTDPHKSLGCGFAWKSEIGDRRSENAGPIRLIFGKSDKGVLPGLRDHSFYRPHGHLRSTSVRA